MYDALGRRIETVDAIAGTTTRYYYDDQRVAVQTQVSGGVETDFRHFVFGNYIDEVLVMGYGTSWINFYYGHDHLYSPVVLYANNGTVVERYEYDAYGQVQVLAPNYELRTTNLYGNPYTFTGRELDTLDAGTLRLMYYRARTYDPETGRFMQRDPLGINPAGLRRDPFEVHEQYTDGMNVYEYTTSNPCRYLDPKGKSVVGILPILNWFTSSCGVYIYCRDNYQFFWPFSKYDHCAPLLAFNMTTYDLEHGDMSAPDAKIYPVTVDRSPGRFIQGGRHAGKPCSCANCDEIRNCVGRERGITQISYRDYITGNNCQNATAKAINRCCLTSTWKPSVRIKETYPDF